jgi:putative lipoprotein
MSIRSYLAAFSFLVLSACRASNSTTPVASLADTRWVLRTLAATPITTPDNSQEISLQFDANTKQVAGFAGCNRFFGRFDQPTATALHLLNLGSTKMYCAARQQLETDYLKALQEVTHYQIEGNTLRLYSDHSPEPLALFEAVHLQ